MHDVERVGGKNASLGEMICNLSGAGVSVPGGFATTAFAFNEFLESGGLNGKIHHLLDNLDVDDIAALNRAGQQIRDWVIEAPFQSSLEQVIREAYARMSAGLDASFACQQETSLSAGLLLSAAFGSCRLWRHVHPGYRVGLQRRGLYHRGATVLARW